MLLYVGADKGKTSVNIKTTGWSVFSWNFIEMSFYLQTNWISDLWRAQIVCPVGLCITTHLSLSWWSVSHLRSLLHCQHSEFNEFLNTSNWFCWGDVIYLWNIQFITNINLWDLKNIAALQTKLIVAHHGSQYKR